MRRRAAAIAVLIIALCQPVWGQYPYGYPSYPAAGYPPPGYAPPAYGYQAPYGYGRQGSEATPRYDAPSGYGAAPYGEAPPEAGPTAGYAIPDPPSWNAAPGYQAPGYATPPAAAGAPASLARAMLQEHNALRARVGVPPLTWSPRLAAGAEAWAQRLIQTRSFGHRPSDPYGENLYTITGGAASPSQVIAAWANEASGYDLRSNSCAGVCGHYTQMVWRATRSLGCGVASDPDREVWVCEYDPAGNVIGYRPY